MTSPTAESDFDQGKEHEGGLGTETTRISEGFEDKPKKKRTTAETEHKPKSTRTGKRTSTTRSSGKKATTKKGGK